jgi:undecaprenyl-diphosphatase
VKKHWKKIALALVAVVVVVLLVSGVLPDLPDAKQVIEDIATALGRWTYLLVGVLAFLETGAFVGLVAPGETTVMVGGVIAGQGEISLVVLIGIVWTCAVLGDTTSFFLGRRLGRDFMLRHGPKFKIDEKRLGQVESYFDRHGGKTILIGRFIGLVRALAPFVAGFSGLSYRRFLPFSIIGCGLWATIFSVLGYIFYRSFDKVAAVAGKATFAFGLTVAVIVAGVYVFRRLRREEDRRRLVAWIEARPVLRPVYRRVVAPVLRFIGPRARFVVDRLTPGRLGLELTTSLAVAGVGFYVFVLYTVILTGDRQTTPADRELLDMADELRTDFAVDVAKVVTDLGAFPTVAALVLAVGVVLATRRHYVELVALVTGAVTIYLGVQITKAGVDRPRPGGGLVQTEGSSFPSGHAAYATIWIGVAVVAARVLPGLASRAALVGAAIGIAVAVGLSRIYLHVHWWSDVAGGWGLGAGVLGLCSAVALIVLHFRHNGRSGLEADAPS